MTKVSNELPFTVPPVVKTIEYAGTPAQAFKRFTGQIGAWWPVATHSLGGTMQGVSVSFDRLEPGGRLVERWQTGEAHVWGTIVSIEPDARIAFTWHVGRNDDQAQLIELRFSAAASGRTRVQLIHSGWESLGATADDKRNDYDEGWDFVLGLYAAGDPGVQA